MDFPEAQRHEDQPAVEAAHVHVAKQAHQVQRGRGQGIVRQDVVQDALADEVAYGDALGPRGDAGAEALVGEALGGVLEGVARELEMDEVGG